MNSALLNAEDEVFIRETDSILFKERDMSDKEIKRLRELEAATRGILQEYQAGMRQMEVRFEALDQDLKLRQNRNPIHHIESRLKKPASIFEKLIRYGKKTNLEDMKAYIMDIAGVRVICSYTQDVYKLVEGLQAQGDLEVVTVKDYIANPKPNGYRSLHVIAKVPVHFLETKHLVPVEVQFRTIAMDFWASLEHDLKYKAVRELEGIDSFDELRDCSRVIEEVEQRMLILAQAIECE